MILIKFECLECHCEFMTDNNHAYQIADEKIWSYCPLCGERIVIYNKKKKER